jgi:hypothetical protein
MKNWFACAVTIAISAMPLSVAAQAPDPKVMVPVSLLQALVNAGQDAPGRVINPLTEQVKALVNEQLAPKKPATEPEKPTAKPAEPEKP